MLKRVLCFSLAVIMVSTALSGCKKSTDASSRYSVIWEEEVVDGDSSGLVPGEDEELVTVSTSSGVVQKIVKKKNSSTSTGGSNNSTGKSSSTATSGGSGTTSTNKNAGNTEKMKNALNFKGQTIVIMREWEKYANGKNQAHDNFNKWLSKTAKRFNVVISEKKQKTTLAGEMLAGVKPEGHLYLTRDNVISMSQKGYIAYLNDAMKETGIDMTADIYNDINTQLGNFNGKQYTIGSGFARVGAAILYNKKMTAAAGYDIDKLISNKQWTWAKMTEIAKKCTVRNASGEVTQWGIGLGNRFSAALVASNGGHIVYPDSSGVFKSYLSDSKTVEAYQQLYNWVNVDKVATYNKTGSGTWDSMDEAFADKKYALYFAGHSAVSKAYSKLTASDYGVAYLPMGPKCNHYVSYLIPEYYYVIPAAYQDMTTNLLLLVDELSQWPVEGYTINEEFRDEWGARYFHSSEQFNMWKNLHFGTATTRVWDGTALVGADNAINIDDLLGGKYTAAVYCQSNNNAYKTACDDLAKSVKYTGKLK